MIHAEDCLDTMRGMDAGSVDMILTSPPYDGIRTYKGFTFDVQAIAGEAYRVIKPGGVVAWNIADQVKQQAHSLTSYRHLFAFTDAGFILHQPLIIEKLNLNQPGKCYRKYWDASEYVWILTKGPPATFNGIEDRRNATAGAFRNYTGHREPDGTYKKYYGKGKKGYTCPEFGKRTNVWRITAGGGKSATDPIAHKHPAIMHEQLARDLITSWSDPGDLVYDPFMGSGTTAVAAIKEGRRWAGSEISGDYCKLIKMRVEAAERVGAAKQAAVV